MERSRGMSVWGVVLGHFYCVTYQRCDTGAEVLHKNDDITCHVRYLPCRSRPQLKPVIIISLFFTAFASKMSLAMDQVTMPSTIYLHPLKTSQDELPLSFFEKIGQNIFALVEASELPDIKYKSTYNLRLETPSRPYFLKSNEMNFMISYLVRNTTPEVKARVLANAALL